VVLVLRGVICEGLEATYSMVLQHGFAASSIAGGFWL
jgi:hypothetical protein